MALTDPSNTIIRGLRLTVGIDGLTLSMGKGTCFLPNTRRLSSDGSSFLTLSNPTPSTWYFAYAYEGEPGVAQLELSTTPPDTPYPTSGSTARTKTGDLTRRYLGSVYVQSSGLVRPFRQTVATDIGNVVLFSAATSGGSIPATTNLLSAFVASTATTIPLNPIIPATATHVRLDVKNASNRQIYIANPDNGAASPTNWSVSAMPNESVCCDVELSSTQMISAILSTTGLLGSVLGLILAGQVNIYIQGYIYDR